MISGDPGPYPQVNQHPGVGQAESSDDAVPFEPDTTVIALQSPNFDRLTDEDISLASLLSFEINASLLTNRVPLGRGPASRYQAY